MEISLKNLGVLGAEIEIRDTEGVEGKGSGTGYLPPPADYGIWGKRRKLHQRSPGENPVENEFWCIELEKTHLIATNLIFF